MKLPSLLGPTVLGVLLALAGCAAPATSRLSPDVSPSVRETVIGSSGVDPTTSPLAPLSGPLHSADLLVYGSGSLDRATLDRIVGLPGIVEALPLSLAQASVQDRVFTLASVDPDRFRRYAPRGSAVLQTAWQRIADGEMAVDPALGRKAVDGDGNLSLGNDESAPRVHVGVWMAAVPRIDAVLNREWGRRLGMPVDNALLVSTGVVSPASVKIGLRKALGDAFSIQVLGPDLDVHSVQTAILTGGSVAAAVGTFNYAVLDGGRIAPDTAWVSANVRTESVPILGPVTCHRVMLPQLRAALTEVVRLGLADRIHPGEYAGCYYPRFIAGTTSLSNHSFGIALDLNVPGNQRGTAGAIDRRVVAVFKKWGFAWGGDWNWTDPMHFELARLVEVT